MIRSSGFVHPSELTGPSAVGTGRESCLLIISNPVVVVARRENEVKSLRWPPRRCWSRMCINYLMFLL